MRAKENALKETDTRRHSNLSYLSATASGRPSRSASKENDLKRRPSNVSYLSATISGRPSHVGSHLSLTLQP